VPSAPCGSSTDQRPQRVFTLNGGIRPEIPIDPGERQFWRIVNTSPDRYADLQLEGQQLEIVALDGMPLSYHDRTRHTLRVGHILLAPAGRVEAVVTGAAVGTRSSLSTRCVDTGPDGDVNPAMVIADVVSDSHAGGPSHGVPATAGTPVYREFASDQLQKLQSTAPGSVVVFTENKNGFYINNKKFAMGSAPMRTVCVSSLQHWRVRNDTRELHPFHIHQVHFLVYAVNDIPLKRPEWLDTVNVSYHGTVDMIMDFTDPIIRGMSVFHCHLLSHEDKGMMGKVLFQ
jgi:FtsP/CotA-like multicopper oxidase with cupredoxin domain